MKTQRFFALVLVLTLLVASSVTKESYGASEGANNIDSDDDRPVTFGNGPSRLYYQGFEEDGWQSEFTGQSVWEDHVARVTHEPHSGSYCLRGNQMAGVIDPITGLPGKGNPLLDWRGAGYDIHTRTPHEMYFSYWFRHDDYDWPSSEDNGEGKLMYLIDVTHNVRAMYLGRQFAKGSLRIRYSNGGYSDRWAWCSDSYHGDCLECRAAGTCDNWGYSSLTLTNSNVFPSADGQWRHFEYYINYDEHYFSTWIDGHKLADSKGIYPDGNIHYDSGLDLHWKGFQLFYASIGDGRNFKDCEDQTGHCVGWQIDDLEVWDGMPDSQPLVLHGDPANQSIHLNWTVSATLPVTSTWQLAYNGPTGDQLSPITSILSPTRAYTLTGLTNYAWYTVTLNAMLDSTPFLIGTVHVMPTDIFIYLPLVLRGN